MSSKLGLFAASDASWEGAWGRGGCRESVEVIGMGVEGKKTDGWMEGGGAPVRASVPLQGRRRQSRAFQPTLLPPPR